MWCCLGYPRRENHTREACGLYHGTMAIWQTSSGTEAYRQTTKGFDVTCLLMVHVMKTCISVQGQQEVEGS